MMPFFVAGLIAVIFEGNKQSNTTHDDDGVTIAKWTLVFPSPKLKTNAFITCKPCCTVIFNNGAALLKWKGDSCVQLA